MGRYLIDVAELAQVIGRSKWTVNRMVDAGTLPFQPVEGMAVRHFRRTDVEAWLGQPLEQAS